MSRLEGLRVLLTRTAADSRSWARPLRAAGAKVMSLPCIRIELASNPATAAELEQALATADWLILTSRRGVEAVRHLLGSRRIPRQTRIAVVGTATAECAETELGRVDLIGAGGTAQALADAIAAHDLFEPGQRCVAALAANAGPKLVDVLTRAGAVCRRIDVYRTIPHPPVEPKRSLASLDAGDLVFSSPTTVAGFVNQIEVDCPYRAWSIGPSTSAALREAGLEVSGEAREPGIAAIVAVIEETIMQTSAATEAASND